jgi:dihydroneopterin aldolase
MGKRTSPAGGATSVARSRHPIVVKLGGSVVRSTELQAWLEAIVEAPVPVVVVPGGGALADEVRAAQKELGFGDSAAHRMALLAMDQLAWAIAGLRKGFEVGAMEDALQYILRHGRVAVWAPYALVANRTDIPHSWTVTSDSLSLWLAGRLGIERLFVIKAIRRERARFSAKQLAKSGVLDEAFPAMLEGSGLKAVLLGRGDQAAFTASLASGAACGATID